MPAANAVMGDDNFGTDLPQTVLDEAEVTEVKSMASFAHSKEYDRITEFFESRVAYYQAYAPDGRDVKSVPPAELRDMWLVSNAIIGELKYIMATYANAKEISNVR